MAIQRSRLHKMGRKIGESVHELEGQRGLEAYLPWHLDQLCGSTRNEWCYGSIAHEMLRALFKIHNVLSETRDENVSDVTYVLKKKNHVQRASQEWSTSDRRFRAPLRCSLGSPSLAGKQRNLGMALALSFHQNEQDQYSKASTSHVC